MTAWARPGVKCVCVKVLPSFHSKGWKPVLRQIYTVREVWGDGTSIALEEFINSGGLGPYWFIEQFRPVTKTQEQDVGLFTHHFEREGADA